MIDKAIRESPPQLENIIEYMLGALRVVLCTKKLHFVSQNRRMENQFVGSALLKSIILIIQKSLISRINEVYVFLIKYH